ncbi:MAG: hypothetical protein ACKO7P_03560 [Bacteroidota bacterium]
MHGPEKLPELRNFVHTPHNFNAKAIAEHYGVNYRALEAADSILSLSDFSQHTMLTGVLEIFI